MAYTAPTVEDLKARFPTFADVDSSLVDGALTEAAGMVDETWIESDFAIARLLYAAHVLTMDGFGSGAEKEAIAQGAGIYKSLKAGGSAIEFAGNSKAATAGTLQGTSYGRRFLQIQRRNFAGPLVV